MIDWTFIGSLEGQSILQGYVPDPQGSDSGVTIATGVDLGQLSAKSLQSLGLHTALTAKLLPYAGLRRQDAVDALAANPLTITKPESDLLDAADRMPTILALRGYWLRDKADGVPDFNALPDAPQTVVASVAFQYGPELRRRTPKFWRDAISLNWSAMVAELRDFGDAYPTRRRKEAAYLATWLATPA